MQVPVTSLTCLHADRRRHRLSISQVVTALSSQALLFYACKRIHEENEGKNCGRPLPQPNPFVPTQLDFSNSDPKGESRTFRSRERKVHAQNERYKERYFHESFVPWNFQIPILCNFRSLELSLSKKETIWNFRSKTVHTGEAPLKTKDSQ